MLASHGDSDYITTDGDVEKAHIMPVEKQWKKLLKFHALKKTHTHTHFEYQHDQSKFNRRTTINQPMLFLP